MWIPSVPHRKTGLQCSPLFVSSYHPIYTLGKESIVETQSYIIGQYPLFVAFSAGTFSDKDIAEFLEFPEFGEIPPLSK